MCRIVESLSYLSNTRARTNACRDVDPDAVEDMTGKALPGAAATAEVEAGAADDGSDDGGDDDWMNMMGTIV